MMDKEYTSLELSKPEKALADIGILAKTALRYNASGRKDVMQKIVDIATEALWEVKDE
jgi:hypothetical protein